MNNVAVSDRKLLRRLDLRIGLDLLSCWDDEGFDPTAISAPIEVILLLAANCCLTDMGEYFFVEETSIMAPEAALGLRMIGLDAGAEALEGMIRYFGDLYPREQATRQWLLYAVPLESFFGFDDRVWTPHGPYPDAFSTATENFDAVASAFVRNCRPILEWNPSLLSDVVEDGAGQNAMPSKQAHRLLAHASGSLESRDYDQAAARLQDVLDILGASCPVRMKLRRDAEDGLVTVYHAMGAEERAENQLRQNLAVRTRELGPAHGCTRRTQYRLAEQLQSQGRWFEAAGVLRTAWEAALARFGPDVSLSIVSAARLADGLRKAGSPDDSLRLFESVAETSGRSLGMRHVFTLKLRRDVADVWITMARYEDAQTRLLEVMHSSIVGLGPMHRFTFETADRLRALLKESGNGEGAEKLIRDAFTTAIAAGKYTGPVSALDVLAAYCAHADEQVWNEHMLWDRLAEIYERHGRESHEARAQRDVLAWNELGLQHWESAAGLLRENLSWYARQSDAGWTLVRTQAMLGAALVGCGAYEEADPLLESACNAVWPWPKGSPSSRDCMPFQFIAWMIQFCRVTRQVERERNWREVFDSLHGLADPLLKRKRSELVELAPPSLDDE